MTGLSSTEMKIITAVQVAVAVFSVFGSTLIISQVTRNKRNRSQLQQQIVLGMSVSDIVFSTAYLFPAEVLQDFEDGSHRRACSAQGFLLQFGIVSVLCNGTLALYYFLVIKLQYTDRQLDKLKPWIHILPILFGLGTALAALFLELYNPVGWNCWISSSPDGCQQTVGANGREPDCIRGDNARIYQLVFFHGPLWLVLLFAIASMSAVYIFVLRQERRSARWRAATIGMKQSQLVLCQSMFYIGAFLTTWILPSASIIMRWITGSRPPTWLVILTACFTPIQGALNCAVYFRPRYLRIKKESGAPAHVVSWNIVKTALGCCDCSGLHCPALRRGSDTNSRDGGDIQTQRTNRSQRLSIRYHDDAMDIEISDTSGKDSATGVTSNCNEHQGSQEEDDFVVNEVSNT